MIKSETTVVGQVLEYRTDIHVGYWQVVHQDNVEVQIKLLAEYSSDPRAPGLVISLLWTSIAMYYANTLSLVG